MEQSQSNKNIGDRKDSLVNKEGALKFSDPIKQKRIQEKLDRLNPGLGDIYKGILYAFADKKNPERISQTAHSIRELTALLPRFKEELPVQESPVRLDEFFKNNLKEWKDFFIWFGKEGRGDPSEEIKQFIRKLGEAGSSLENHRMVLKRVVELHPTRSMLPEHFHEAFIKYWIELNKWFMKHVHHHNLHNRVSQEVDEKEFAANVWYFEDLLYRALVEVPFFEPVSELDALLKIAAPSQNDVDTLVRLIEQEGHYRYFFEKCENHLWIRPLLDRGFFKEPREPIRENGYIRFLNWPESQFLMRVASQNPEAVFEIIKNLDSANQSVLDNFVEAALNSPSTTAAKYVDLIEKKRWIQNPYNLRLPNSIADLMEKLAADGEISEAIRLAGTLFDLRVEQPRKFTDDTDEELSYVHPDAKPYFDEWKLNEIVKKKMGKLSEAAPAELFEVYVNRLHDAIRLEKRENSQYDFYEYSHIWRPNLSRARHRHEDAKNILLDGLIDLIERNRENSEMLKKFVAVLKRHAPALFRRMEMFVYNIQPDDFISEAEKLLKNSNIIIAYNLRREYLPLLEGLFTKISAGAREDILRTIVRGPNFNPPSDLSPEQAEKIRDNWRALYFGAIKKHLPNPYKEQYKQIIDRQGEPYIDDGEIKSWAGGQSPISQEELAGMEPEAVVGYLIDYKEPGDPFSKYSSTGLGMTFSGVVALNPEKYAPLSKHFIRKKIRPLYIYHFLYGLKEAIKQKKCFDWNSVIELCGESIDRKDAGNSSEPASDREQNWHSVRKAIADLLGDALGNTQCEPPIELREKVWSILSALLTDDEPTPDDEERDGGGALDPTSLSINTVRGEAMHAAISYGLWVARKRKEKSKNSALMPEEVKQILDEHLDEAGDPSLAIRSVYGWRLPNLFYLDQRWTKDRLSVIFPADEAKRDFFAAALDGYMSNNVYFDIFDALEDVYRRGISLLGTNENGKRGYKAVDINERLPQHLMLAYVHDSKYDDLIHYFFKTAPAKARGQAVNFVGRVILQELPAYENSGQVKARAAKLWGERLAGTESAPGVDELQEFGWWFKRSPFTKKETMDKFLGTLELTKGVIDVPYEIIEELPSYANDYPMETITALDLIARAEREYHEFSYKSEEYKETIRRIKASGRGDAIQKADELIHFIGSRGFMDFKELL